MESKTEEFSFSSRFNYVLRRSIGIESLSPSSGKTEYFLPSDVKNAVKKAETGREIEKFETTLRTVANISARESDNESDSESDSDFEADNEPYSKCNLSWSTQAPKLCELLKNKKNWKLAKSDNLYAFFHDLSLKSLKIKFLDEGLRRFENVTTLNISNNKISTLGFLPYQTRILHAYDNQIEVVEIQEATASKMVHLGLGYNNIRSLSFWIGSFRMLRSLDISYNGLCSLDETVNSLVDLEYLSRLHVVGNPFTLLRNYKGRILHRLEKLKYLDNEKVDISGPASFESTSHYENLVVLRIQVERISYIFEVNGNVKGETAHIPDNGDNLGLEAKKIKKEYFVAFEISLPNLSIHRSKETLITRSDNWSELEKEDETEARSSNSFTKDIDFTVEYTFEPTKVITDELDLNGVSLSALLVSRETEVQEESNKNIQEENDTMNDRGSFQDQVLSQDTILIGETSLSLSKFFTETANGYSAVQNENCTFYPDLNERNSDIKFIPQNVSITAELNPDIFDHGETDETSE